MSNGVRLWNNEIKKIGDNLKICGIVAGKFVSRDLTPAEVDSYNKAQV